MDNEFESNSYDDSIRTKLVDVRIILTNLDYIEAVSKAVSNFDLSNFNVNISSIIPIKDLEIAKNNIIGADLVLIAIPSSNDANKIFNKFKNSLKTDYNYIEYLKLPSLEELDDYGYDYEEDNLFEDEIANSIIRAGLYNISNLSSINESKKEYYAIKEKFNSEMLKFDKSNKENELLLSQSKSLREKNEKLIEEIKILQKDLDSIKSDFSDLKSRFESIHSKNSLEVYSLNELWQELFSESLSEEIYRFILISTDNFRPKNLMIGQGAICAESKEDALDWLKIIKTAFILSDANKRELDFNNFSSNFRFEEFDDVEFDSSYDASDLGLDIESSYNESNLNPESKSSFGASSMAYDSKSSFGASSKVYESESSIEDSSDEFSYNKRYEGNNNLNQDFRELKFDDDFGINENFENLKKEKKPSDEINVFNLRSLKSLKDDEEDSDEEYDSDYDSDYDGGEMDDDEGDMFNSFSNLWD